jgi:hypothetical protein
MVQEASDALVATRQRQRSERNVAMTFDSMILIPITRATLYDPEDEAWEAADCGIHRLDLDHLAVDSQVNVGQVTLATSGSHHDGRGLEVDLVPEAARALAHQLLLAADAVGPAG